MNQNDWVEYFEAINGRKPSMQEFQAAREKGEFVVERKEAPTPTTEAPAPATKAQAPAQEAPVAPSAPLSQEQTAVVQPQPSAKTLQPIPRPKKLTFSFNKQPQIGAAVAGLVAVISFAWFFFFSGGPSLDGIWSNISDSDAIVYETNQKGMIKDGNIKIQSLTKGDKANKELSQFLEKVNKSDLKSLKDFDRIFSLKTKEVIVAHSEKNTYYNLIQQDGTMVSFTNDRYRLRSLYFEPKELKKTMTYRKVAMAQAFVGKWNMYYENNTYNDTITISKNGILTRRQRDPQIFAVYSLEEAEKDEALKNGEKFSEDKFKEKFYEIQSKLEAQGYHVNNPKDIYKKVGDYFYFLVTNGGKTIIVLTNHFEYDGKIEKVK
ncbi:hypothetical protein HMPREF9626_0738 [Streptococcus parasanguinis F0405]|uniref:Uncharacterized protein n=1 Tax=Streptococcus parasanguinis F0405 TaxID=905067 RepID=E3CD88_STRPA|nr:hypothetical protein [Streptococcus parasanguinis]EFQ55230.1 hypothetical protein HMPREF9626_0738 [Streptococcus parasanguinis F0405]